MVVEIEIVDAVGDSLYYPFSDFDGFFVSA